MNGALHRWFKMIATLGPIGYLPASGTLATFATIPLVIVIKLVTRSVQQEFMVIAGLSLLAFFIIHKAQQAWPWTKDPRQIVLDELIGCLWAFCGTHLTVSRIIIGFLLFRFFDIAKPFGIRSCERLPGAFGILVDDVVAGNYTLIFLFLLYA
jgi:phosphatidylglycerophosphatase A